MPKSSNGHGSSPSQVIVVQDDSIEFIRRCLNLNSVAEQPLISSRRVKSRKADPAVVDPQRVRVALEMIRDNAPGRVTGDLAQIHEVLPESAAPTQLLGKSQLPPLLALAQDAADVYSHDRHVEDTDKEPFAIMEQLAATVRGRTYDGTAFIERRGESNVLDVKPIEVLSESRVATLEAIVLQECVRAAAYRFQKERVFAHECGASHEEQSDRYRTFISSLHDHVLAHLEARGAFYPSTVAAVFGVGCWVSLVQASWVSTPEYQMRLDSTVNFLGRELGAGGLNISPEAQQLVNDLTRIAIALNLKAHSGQESELLLSHHSPWTVLKGLWTAPPYWLEQQELAILVDNLLRTVDEPERVDAAVLSGRLVARDLATRETQDVHTTVAAWSPVIARAADYCSPGSNDIFDQQFLLIANTLLSGAHQRDGGVRELWETLIGSQLVDMDRQLLNIWLYVLAARNESVDNTLFHARTETAEAIKDLLEAEGAGRINPFGGFGAAAPGAAMLARTLPESDSGLARHNRSDSLDDVMTPPLKNTSLGRHRLRILAEACDMPVGTDTAALSVLQQFESPDFERIRTQLASRPDTSMPKPLQRAFVGGHSSLHLRIMAEALGVPHAYAGPLQEALLPEDLGSLVITSIAQTSPAGETHRASPLPILTRLPDDTFQLWGELDRPPLSATGKRFIDLLHWAIPVGMHENLWHTSQGRLSAIETLAPDEFSNGHQDRLVFILFGAIETALQLGREDLVPTVLALIKGQPTLQDSLANEALIPAGLCPPEIARWAAESTPASTTYSHEEILMMFPTIPRPDSRTERPR